MLKHDVKVDGLLIIVDDIGLPILTREYGNTKIPPYAAIGIVSAVFHACTNGTGWKLQMMESNNRRIDYKQFDDGILYIFIHQKQDDNDDCSRIIQKGFDIVNSAVKMLCIRDNLKQLETSQLKTIMMHNINLIDSIISQMYTNIQLIMDQPIAIVPRSLNSKSTEQQSKTFDDVVFACCISKGTICIEYLSRQYRNKISSRTLVLLSLFADFLLGDQVDSAERLLYLDLGKEELQVKSFFQKQINDQICVCIIRGFSNDQRKISGIMEWLQKKQTADSASSVEAWNILPVKLLSKLPFGCLGIIALQNGSLVSSSRIHLYSLSPELLRDFQIQIPIEKRKNDQINLEEAMSALHHFAARTFLNNQELGILDHSETHELYVYHHSRRGPLQFYTLYFCAALIDSASLDDQQFILAGDILHNHFLYAS